MQISFVAQIVLFCSSVQVKFYEVCCVLVLSVLIFGKTIIYIYTVFPTKSIQVHIPLWNLNSTLLSILKYNKGLTENCWTGWKIYEVN